MVSSDEMISKTSFFYFSSLISVAFGYITLFVAARFIGQKELGDVSFAISLVGLFTIVADLGLNRSHTKKISEGTSLSTCISTYMILKILLVLLFIVAVIVFDVIWYSVGNQDQSMRDLIFLSLAYYVPFLITYVFVQTFLALREVKNAQIISLSETSIRMIATIIVAFTSMGALGLAMTYAISGFCSMIVALSIAKRYLPPISFRPIDKPLLKEYLTYAAPIAVATVLAIITINLDKVIIQFSSSSIQTAIYYGSQQLLRPFLIMGAAVMTLAFPAISELYFKKKDDVEIAYFVSSSLRYLSLLVIPVALFLGIFSKQVLTLFLSSEFSSGWIAFSILTFAYGVSTFTMIFRSEVLGIGEARKYARLMIIYFLIIASLDFLLIPRELFGVPLLGLGINGAAIAIFIGEIANILMFFQNSRRQFNAAMRSNFVRILLSATASMIISYPLYIWLVSFVAGGFANLLAFISIMILYAGLYCIFAVLMKAIKRKEWGYLFSRIIHR